jgi:hypothetical protein
MRLPQFKHRWVTSVHDVVYINVPKILSLTPRFRFSPERHAIPLFFNEATVTFGTDNDVIVHDQLTYN